jgi:hypothetical protein
MLFLMHVSRAESPRDLAEDMANLYPQVPRHCLVDGTCGADWPDVCARLGVEMHLGLRLKPIANGTAWIQRWMALALAQTRLPDDLIIRFDADCRLWRRFVQLPYGDIAGHLACHRLNRQLFDRGGVTAYRRSTLLKIMDSGLLNDPTYCCPRRFAYFNRGELLHCDAQTIGKIAQILNLQYHHWAEVYNAWREPMPFGNWAITATRGYAEAEQC